MEQSLLLLVVSPDMEPIMIDWLLQNRSVTRFYSESVFDYGHDHRTLNLTEQVEGRQRQIQFRVPLPTAVAASVLEDLQSAFAGSGIVYWLLPLQAVGQIGTNGP
jgi:hypothetical protein